MKTPAALALALATLSPALALAGSAGPALIEPEPVPMAMPVSHDWTGPYVGLQLGYADFSEGIDGDDVIGGLNAGYDWDFGNWVLGFGADVSFGGVDTDEGDIDWISRLKLRGGYDFGRTLLYVTTGAAYAASDDLDDSWGYFGGLGLETMLTDQISLSGEVAANRFDDFEDQDDVHATTVFIGVNYRF
ncbi:MAG: outer membrane protein [Tropicimonas sp.]|uniref:outer membrane protein n=1 Tax=Tropicimonas sp. TaxID=2067044 RepID=UPI003A837118